MTTAGWKDQFQSNLKTIKKNKTTLKTWKLNIKLQAFKYSSLSSSLRFQQTEDNHRKLAISRCFVNFYSFININRYQTTSQLPPFLKFSFSEKTLEKISFPSNTITNQQDSKTDYDKIISQLEVCLMKPWLASYWDVFASDKILSSGWWWIKLLSTKPQKCIMDLGWW